MMQSVLCPLISVRSDLCLMKDVQKQLFSLLQQSPSPLLHILIASIKTTLLFHVKFDMFTLHTDAMEVYASLTLPQHM